MCVRCLHPIVGRFSMVNYQQFSAFGAVCSQLCTTLIGEPGWRRYICSLSLAFTPWVDCGYCIERRIRVNVGPLCAPVVMQMILAREP